MDTNKSREDISTGQSKKSLGSDEFTDFAKLDDEIWICELVGDKCSIQRIGHFVCLLNVILYNR